MAITETLRMLLDLMKCCGVSKEEGRAIGILIQEEQAAELLLDWFLELKEMPTEDEIVQAAIQACLEADPET